MASPVFFRVHEHQVQAFIEPGGEVHGLLRRISEDTRDNAKVIAPKRTGKLSQYIFAGNPKRDGVHELSVTVAANVGYALYVHEGTTGPITSKSGKKLKIPIAGGYIFRESVAGQAPQPFLAQGLEMALLENLRR